MCGLSDHRRKLDPCGYNDGSLLRIRGIVVKSQGSADKVYYAHAIEEAIVEVEKNVPDKINVRLEELLTRRELV